MKLWIAERVEGICVPELSLRTQVQEAECESIV
jgi:hypothetical protein